ncbi:head GIN domain-containing protein [Bacteroidota bacterium]
MNTQLKNIAFLSLFFTLFFSSCSEVFFDCVRGNGNITQETRDLSGFTKLTLEGSFEVSLVQSDEYEVIVDADENLIDYIETDIRNNSLIIGTTKGRCVKSRNTIIVRVAMPEIHAISMAGSGLIYTDKIITSDMDVVLAGSGDIDIEELICDNLNIRQFGSGDIDIYVDALNHVKISLSGSGDINILGVSETSDIKIYGSGDVDASNLNHVSCDAYIEGSGDISVSASDYINVRIIGSGDFYYKGNPVLDIDDDGSGEVKQI